MLKPNFDPKNGTILLPVDTSILAIQGFETFEFREKIFNVKSEFHITLVGRERGFEIVQALKKDASLFNKIELLISNQEWAIKPRNEIFHIAKPINNSGLEATTTNAESIIQMVDMPNSDKFFSALSELIGKAITVPPLHITLFTFAEPKGIGIATEEELLSCTPTKLRLLID